MFDILSTNKIPLVPLFNDFDNQQSIDILMLTNNNILLLDIIYQWFTLNDTSFIMQNTIVKQFNIDDRVVQINLILSESFNKNKYDLCFYLYDFTISDDKLNLIVENISSNLIVIIICDNTSLDNANSLSRHYIHLNADVKFFINYTKSNNDVITIFDNIVKLYLNKKTLKFENNIQLVEINRPIINILLSNFIKIKNCIFCNCSNKKKQKLL